VDIVSGDEGCALDILDNYCWVTDIYLPPYSFSWLHFCIDIGNRIARIAVNCTAM